jgi:hypothetical protein
MKRAVAIKKALTVAGNLRKAAGLIGTPGTEFEAVRVKRAWLFGSTVKGKENPNDVDILLEVEEVGRHTRFGKGGRLDKDMARRYGRGCGYTVSSTKEAYRFIKGGMTMIRLHNAKWDGEFGDIAETKVLIYPRNDLVRLNIA